MLEVSFLFEFVLDRLGSIAMHRSLLIRRMRSSHRPDCARHPWQFRCDRPVGQKGESSNVDDRGLDIPVHHGHSIALPMDTELYAVDEFTQDQKQILTESLFLCNSGLFLSFHTLHTSAVFLTFVELERA